MTWFQLGPEQSQKPQEIGAKAAVLGQMLAAGLPVPKTWVIPPRTTLDDAWPSLFAALPPKQRFAVRSSALEEDGRGASAAGIFESFLDLERDSETLKAAVERCRESLHSERANSYRDGSANAAELGMAVMIQGMIAADYAGVLFTPDNRARPETEGHIVVEVVEGLGAALVDGHVSPRRYLTRRDQGESGAWECQSSGDLDRDVPEAILNELRGFALKLETLLDSAVDIEWAVADERLWLLQARPLTAALPPGLGDDQPIWTSANSQEALKDPVTPLTWTFLQPMIERGRALLFRSAGFEEIDGPGYLRLFRGRPYFNIQYFRRFLRQLPGVPENIFDALIFGEGIGEIHFRWRSFNFKSVKMASLLLKLRLRSYSRLTRFQKDFEAKLKACEQTTDRLDPHALLDEFERLGALIEQCLHQHVEGTALAGASFMLLDLLIRDCGMDQDFGENAASQLMSAESERPEARAINVLTAMNKQLKDCARLFLSKPEDHAQLRRASTCESPEEARSLSQFQDRVIQMRWFEFLAAYGHRAENEAELGQERWREDPRPLQTMLLGMIHAEQQTLAAAREDSRPKMSLEQWQRMMEASLRRRTGFLSRGPRLWAFRWLLRQARLYAPYREVMKDLALKVMQRLRTQLLWVGRELLGPRGLDAEAVFCLEWSELQGLLRDPGTASCLLERIERRRVQRRENFDWRPPNLIVGMEVPVAGQAYQNAQRVLSGVAVAAGLVRGRARVIENLEQATELQAGEVLVAPMVNAGWTPLFRVASAVVADMGGLLSHAAVVAREYGLCSVFGVSHASAVIETGQWITVDGRRGLVFLE